MRKRFAVALKDLADRDRRVWLLTADVGFTVLERFAEHHPDRYINVGVAEQNMVAIAMGLAAEGQFPFCYSIATFATMRPYEFIRHACYQDLPIRIVGSGRDKEYSHNGFTHWAIEDRQIMSGLPGMKVFAPGTEKELNDDIYQNWDKPYPIYFNLLKNA